MTVDEGLRGDRRIATRRISLVLMLLAVFGTGCGGTEERSPIPDSTMVDVLIELHLSAARAEVTDEVPAEMRDSIFTAYEVDSTTYAEAIAYFAEHPDRYAEIYSRVLDRLNSERIPLGHTYESGTEPSAAPPPRSAP